jgi:3'-phosphoadenosine 5'-phosphosulfate sulfotransferase (PAPS reductase)/FAD synthetase
MPTNEDLKALQSMSLEQKVRVSQTRIIEWYEHYKGEVYVSFSGGKDSTVLLDLVRRVYPDVEAVFVDTGLEYPEIKQFVNTFDNVTTIRPKMSFREVIEKYGYPVVSKEVADSIQGARKGQQFRIDKLKGDLKDKDGKKSKYNQEKWEFLIDAPFEISHYCCNVMKKAPAHTFEKETGKKPYIGTLTSDSRMRQSAWYKHGCNAFEAARPQSKPLSFWSEQDILRYLKFTGIPYSEVYGDIVPKFKYPEEFKMEELEKTYMETTGLSRTGCVFCLFGIHLETHPNRFEQMKVDHPQLYNYCMKDWEEGGLGMEKVLDFLDVEY